MTFIFFVHKMFSEDGLRRAFSIGFMSLKGWLMMATFPIELGGVTVATTQIHKYNFLKL